MGKVRGNNEDNLYADGVILTAEIRDRPFAIDGSSPAPVIFAVCDGMGGEEDGETASLAAVQLLGHCSERIKASRNTDCEACVREYVGAVNEAIHRDNAGKRVGTTLALASVTKMGIYCFNIGDSRVYCLKEGTLTQVTNDHTLTGERIKNGAAAAEPAKGEDGKHKLTRCIGIGKGITAEAYPPIREKCRLLICSDGLTDSVSRDELEDILKYSVKTSDAANTLIGSALERGGRDNVTVVVLDTAKSRSIVLRHISNKLKNWV
jgi:protein phosphatase